MESYYKTPVSTINDAFLQHFIQQLEQKKLMSNVIYISSSGLLKMGVFFSFRDIFCLFVCFHLSYLNKFLAWGGKKCAALFCITIILYFWWM